MTYQDFSDRFLLSLVKSYRNKQIPLHALVDTDLWIKIFPNYNNETGQFHWYLIKFNAFTLSDEEGSLLIIYSIPTQNQKKEPKFIGIRLNNNRDQVILYTLRRPEYVGDSWDLYQYDFKKDKNISLGKLYGTDSIREFKNHIERLSFSERPPLLSRILTSVTNK
ncbi:MAG: hypothetical protein KBT20_03460 [Bacteroidales bacterium]|nr:hypothetical protein [Candidatus Liminaster caballi]